MSVNLECIYKAKLMMQRYLTFKRIETEEHILFLIQRGGDRLLTSSENGDSVILNNPVGQYLSSLERTRQDFQTKAIYNAKG